MGYGASKEILNNEMHILIIGGGFGGFSLAHQLITKNICKVTLVDPKDSYVHYIGSLRAAVEKGWYDLSNFQIHSFQTGRVL